MNRQPLNRASLLSRLFGGVSAVGGTHARRPKRRRLGFEQCESRAMLSATISGVKYETVNSNGFSPGDTPLGGVIIDLFKDNGDGIFNDATDVLFDQETTAAGTGAYTFSDVPDGHYYIREQVPAGYTQSAGPPFYTLDVIGGGVYVGSETAIDDFTAPDPATVYLINVVDPNPLLLQQDSAGILGGQRDLLIEVLGSSNPISASGFIGTESPGHDVFNLGSASSGPGTKTTLQYDGVDADTTALNNAQGLAADLTAGGANGIRLDFNFLQMGSGTTIDFTAAATGASGTASFAGTITANPAGFSVFVPFASFTTPVGFSFAAVTSLQFAFNASGVQDVDFELNQIVAAGRKDTGFNFGNFRNVPEPSSLSGFVYLDCNGNGVKDPNEKGIAGVKITLTGTDELGNAVNLTTTTNAAGAYSFNNLRPGTYTLTELQPSNYVDGKDTIGTPGGITGNDVFSNIILLAGVHGKNNNFGEKELKSDYKPKPSICGCNITPPPAKYDKPCDKPSGPDHAGGKGGGNWPHGSGNHGCPTTGGPGHPGGGSDNHGPGNSSGGDSVDDLLSKSASILASKSAGIASYQLPATSVAKLLGKK